MRCLKHIEKSHPADSFLHTNLIPSIWCSGCGIGIVVNAFIQTIERLKIDVNKICVVSGIGCTGKVVEYLNFGVSSTVDYNIIDYAAQLKSDRPHSHVIVFSDNSDFLISGAKDFIEIGRKNVGLFIIHINNIIYTVTEHDVIPTTPFMRASFDEKFELPFNIPHLVKSYGARYVARWTPLHVSRLMYSIADVLQKPGFSVIEVITPCLVYYANDGRIGETLDRMRFFHDNAVIKHGECTENLDIRNQGKIIVGKFVDRE